MEIKALHTLYFSPAYSTRDVVRAVASGVSSNVTHHDITQGLSEPLSLTKDELVIIGVPSYSGRVPALAAKYLAKIKGDNTPAILLCVYGNREYEDTLLELKEICTQRGLRVVSAGAFIARHSIFPNVAEGRPNREDMEQARSFGERSLAIALKGEVAELSIKGNVPYRSIGSIPLKPRANPRCNSCGTCVRLCPVGAIREETPRKTDKNLCISCARCIAVCPEKARAFRGLIYSVARRQFTKKYSKRREIELLFAEHRNGEFPLKNSHDG